MDPSNPDSAPALPSKGAGIMIKENLTLFLFGDNNQDKTDSAVEKFMNYVPGNWEDWKNYCDELHERCLGAFEANNNNFSGRLMQDLKWWMQFL